MKWQIGVAFTIILLALLWLTNTWQSRNHEGTKISLELDSGYLIITNNKQVTVQVRASAPFQIIVNPGGRTLQPLTERRIYGQRTYQVRRSFTQSKIELHFRHGKDLDIHITSVEPVQVRVFPWNSAEVQERRVMGLMGLFVGIYYLSHLDKHEWIYRIRDRIVYKK